MDSEFEVWCMALFSIWAVHLVILTTALARKVHRRWGWPWASAPDDRRKRSDWALVYWFMALIGMVATSMIGFSTQHIPEYRPFAYALCSMVVATVWLLHCLRHEYWGSRR